MSTRSTTTSRAAMAQPGFLKEGRDFLGTNPRPPPYPATRRHEMFCDRCGTRLSDPANFCPACGKAPGVTPLMPIDSRIAGHVRLVGILWLALSAFHLIPGLILLSLSGHGMSFLSP